MTLDYNKLLKTTYELEGLIMLQTSDHDHSAEMVDSMIAEKINALAEAVCLRAKVEAEEVNEPEPLTSDEKELIEDAPQEAQSETEADAEKEAEKAADAEKVADAVSFEESGLAAGPRLEAGKTEPEKKAEIADAPAVTLDEKLARERAKDIYKAFTLNDKFRFRRELFRDSQQEFDEALDVIAQMCTIDEAEEYVYDDLCWDPENDAVKEFMEVVARHF